MKSYMNNAGNNTNNNKNPTQAKTIAEAGVQMFLHRKTLNFLCGYFMNKVE